MLTAALEILKHVTGQEAETRDDPQTPFYGPLTPEDLYNGKVQVGNYVATGQDLYLDPSGILNKVTRKPLVRAFDANKPYQVVQVTHGPGKGGLVLDAGEELRVVYFANEGEESGWAELFFKLLPTHSLFRSFAPATISGGPQNLPGDILDLLTTTSKGAPMSIDKIVAEEVATFRPNVPGDVSAFRRLVAQALVYLQNTGNVVIDPEERMVYLTRKGSQ